jgi:preprotein translocase subunit SecY
MPSSVKNATAASRSSTTMATLSMRCIPPHEAAARWLERVQMRLSLVSGIVLAFAVATVPVLSAWLSDLPLEKVSVSGFPIVLGTTTCLALMRAMRQEH